MSKNQNLRGVESRILTSSPKEPPVLAFTIEDTSGLANIFGALFCKFHSGLEEAEIYRPEDITGFSVNGSLITDERMKVVSFDAYELGPLAETHTLHNYGVRHPP